MDGDAVGAHGPPRYIRALRRLRCAIGWHTPITWFYPTGSNAPAYEQRVECLWCQERFR